MHISIRHCTASYTHCSITGPNSACIPPCTNIPCRTRTHTRHGPHRITACTYALQIGCNTSGPLTYLSTARSALSYAYTTSASRSFVSSLLRPPRLQYSTDTGLCLAKWQYIIIQAYDSATAITVRMPEGASTASVFSHSPFHPRNLHASLPTCWPLKKVLASCPQIYLNNSQYIP